MCEVDYRFPCTEVPQPSALASHATASQPAPFILRPNAITQPRLFRCCQCTYRSRIPEWQALSDPLKILLSDIRPSDAPASLSHDAPVPCHECGHLICPSCILTSGDETPIRTVGGASLLRCAETPVMWECPVCNGVAGLNVLHTTLSDDSERPAVMVDYLNNRCQSCVGWIRSDVLVLNPYGQYLGTIDMTRVERNGPWAFHLLAHRGGDSKCDFGDELRGRELQMTGEALRRLHFP